MENIKLGDLYLSKNESRNIIELLAKMRNINDYKSKSSDRLHEIFKKQSKNKERIDNIREDLKDLSYKLSKSELKEIKTNLYNIEKRKKINTKIEMAIKGNNTIKYNHGEKYIKMLFTIYADLECLLDKMSTCQNDPNKLSTTKINKHTPSGYSIFTNCSFDESKNKISYYRGDDCMKKLCKDLREHSTKIINYEKKKMISLTTEEKVHYNKQKVCYICKKEFDNNDKKQQKVRDHCHYTGKYRGAAHNICNLRYKIPKEIPVVFHNGSTYDYHCIIKELIKEFEGNFECLGENTEKYITFLVPIKKKIDNKDLEITYKIKFIDSYRFMSSSLSKLVDNLSEGIHSNKCSDCESNLDYIKI